MVDYDKSTGNAGTIRIRDLGYQIQFWLYCSDNQTFASALPWNGRVNGQDVSGTVNWTAGRGEAHVASYDVGSNQTVTFGIGDTGTSGFGGPTSHSVDVNRASAPNAPTNLRVRDDSLRHNSFGVDYDNGGDNGAGVDQYRVHWRRADTYELVWEDMGSMGYSNPLGGGGPPLVPGLSYKIGVQAHNNQGWGSWSSELLAYPLPGVWVPDPDDDYKLKVAVPYCEHEGAWHPAVAYVGRINGDWRQTVY